MFIRFLLVIFVFVAVAIGGLWFVFGQEKGPVGVNPTASPDKSPTPTLPQLVQTPTQKPISRELILHNVPFVSQAPTGNWSDERQQDGCEEAASYMAILWARSELLPTAANMVEQKLLEISDWEEKEFGDYHDTSVEDTVKRIFKGYFKYENVEAQYGIDTEDIKRELYRGNLIIVPVDGQLLGNPYFTPPGPERHNLLIRGYDPKTDEFVTNDNGTKRGDGYRYRTAVLTDAIIDYPTGNHKSIVETRRAMIVVGR